MAPLPVRMFSFVLFVRLWLSEADIISDITTSSVDESRALEIKAETFWQSLLQATDEMKLEEHVVLYVDAERVIANLPTENKYVREALTEALMRLRRSDEMLLKEAAGSSQLAADALATPLTGGSFYSFLTGGQGFFAKAISGFVDNSKYPQRLRKQVQDRQANILPILKGASDITGNVLKDCRLASKRSFDALKYDIYNKGVPKTPQEAKDVAYRIVDAAGESRHRFTSFITEAANSITRDVQAQDENPATTVIRSSLQSFGTKETEADTADLLKMKPASTNAQEAKRRSATEMLINL